MRTGWVVFTCGRWLMPRGLLLWRLDPELLGGGAAVAGDIGGGHREAVEARAELAPAHLRQRHLVEPDLARPREASAHAREAGTARAAAVLARLAHALAIHPASGRRLLELEADGGRLGQRVA